MGKGAGKRIRVGGLEGKSSLEENLVFTMEANKGSSEKREGKESEGMKLIGQKTAEKKRNERSKQKLVTAEEHQNENGWETQSTGPGKVFCLLWFVLLTRNGIPI